MTEVSRPKLPKWPFLVGDVLLVAVAVYLLSQGRGPIALWEGVLCAAAIGLGAVLAVMPFVMEYRVGLQLDQTAILAEALKQLQQLEAVARNVSAATAQWQGVQDRAAQTLQAAEGISDKMAAEASAFTEFLKKANDSERATLRLEVEKLQRAQSEWLQVVVRMLDHVFALHRAAVRAAKPEVAEQISNFQEACRDIARRVGLVAVEAAPDESFDPTRHRTADTETPPADGARIEEVLAPGYTFQSQPLRPVLVKLKAGSATEEIEQAVQPAETSAPELQRALL